MSEQKQQLKEWIIQNMIDIVSSARYRKPGWGGVHARMPCGI